MKFEWDERKNQINIQKHRMDFKEAYKVFESPMLVNIDNRGDYGEERWVGIGMIDARVVTIAFAEPEEDVIRVISLRKAITKERKRYEKAYKNELGRI